MTSQDGPIGPNGQTIFPSQGVEIDTNSTDQSQRPPLVTSLSSPTYHTPIRHHRHGHSSPRHVKETLNARSQYTNSEDDGAGQHRINQYIIKEEIGRGSFGAVHIATDQFENKYAIKEFSKSRMRKRAQSHILRKPHAVRGRGSLGPSFNSPLHRHSEGDAHDREIASNPLHFIRQEVAIMKKLDHEHLVSLIEVLDDPTEDSLYMVLELCQKGVIMKVELDEHVQPYPEETCRKYFRHMMLGIEYLHAQGIVHRDIKPDNLLLTDEDTVKIVDFGVSEMFEKEQDMKTAKSAGSPAFLPPELCVVGHGEISGKAADIWSMGVTLYCLYYGRIPFQRNSVMEMFEAIRSDDAKYDQKNIPSELVDLLKQVLEKNPDKRIDMSGLREHPWVTKNGTDLLISKEDNISALIDPPTEEEMNSAITRNFQNLLAVMRAVRKFKRLIFRRRPNLMENVLAGEDRLVQPPQSMSPPPHTVMHHSKSVDSGDRRPIHQALTREGVHFKAKRAYGERADPSLTFGSQRDPNSPNTGEQQSSPSGGGGGGGDRPEILASPTAIEDLSLSPSQTLESVKAKDGDGLPEEPQLLSIGASSEQAEQGPVYAVCESPPATDIDVYETAYHDEVERIRKAHGRQATIFLTRRVEKDEGGEDGGDGRGDGAHSAWKRALGKVGPKT